MEFSKDFYKDFDNFAIQFLRYESEQVDCLDYWNPSEDDNVGLCCGWINVSQLNDTVYFQIAFYNDYSMELRIKINSLKCENYDNIKNIVNDFNQKQNKEEAFCHEQDYYNLHGNVVFCIDLFEASQYSINEIFYKLFLYVNNPNFIEVYKKLNNYIKINTNDKFDLDFIRIFNNFAKGFSEEFENDKELEYAGYHICKASKKHPNSFILIFVYFLNPDCDSNYDMFFSIDTSSYNYKASIYVETEKAFLTLKRKKLIEEFNTVRQNEEAYFWDNEAKFKICDFDIREHSPKMVINIIKKYINDKEFLDYYNKIRPKYKCSCGGFLDLIKNDLSKYRYYCPTCKKEYLPKEVMNGE